MRPRHAPTLDRPPRRRARLLPLLVALVAAAALTACDAVGELLGSEGEDATSEEAADTDEGPEGADEDVADDSGDDVAGDDAADSADADGAAGDGAGEGASGDDGGADGAEDAAGATDRPELVEALPGTLDEVLVADDVNLNTYLGDVAWSDGDRLTVVCGSPLNDRIREQGVWGTDVYALSNHPCLVGVHAGLLDIEEGGTAAIELLERFDHPDVEVEDRNGVEARRWGRSGAGFRFLDPEELDVG